MVVRRQSDCCVCGAAEKLISLEDGPVGLDARDSWVLDVAVADLSVGHLRPVDHQTHGGSAGARRRRGCYADYLSIGAPAGGETPLTCRRSGGFLG